MTHQNDYTFSQNFIDELIEICYGKVVMSYFSKVKMSYWR